MIAIFNPNALDTSQNLHCNSVHMVCKQKQTVNRSEMETTVKELRAWCWQCALVTLYSTHSSPLPFCPAVLEIKENTFTQVHRYY